jgi:hypothetical protein
VSSDNWRLLFDGLTALGALVAASQVWFVRLQLRDTRRWNRMTFALEYLSKWEKILELERALNASFLKLLDRKVPLSTDDLNKRLSDEERQTRTELSRFLNAMESYCTAVNLGIADEHVALSLYEYKFPRHFNELKPYIDHQRSELNSSLLYQELETVVKKWTQVPARSPRYP